MPSKLSITKERTAELVAEFGANEHDTGNPDVQGSSSALPSLSCPTEAPWAWSTCRATSASYAR